MAFGIILACGSRADKMSCCKCDDPYQCGPYLERERDLSMADTSVDAEEGARTWR